jgi:pimeloyl-ACP methyl ester carboxylesterase
MTLEYARNGNIRIAYQRRGSGPVIVFLHGIGGNRTNWQDQLDAFSDDYLAIAWDARGYGDSGDPAEPLVFSQFAEDLKCVLDQLGAEKAHLVGLSMGGMIAQDFYARYPDRVATLVLVGTASGFGTMSAQEQQEFLRARLAPLEQGRTPKEIAPQVIGLLLGPHASGEARNKLLSSLESLRTEPYKQALRAIVTTDFRQVLPAVAVPTLVIVGACDKVLPPPASEALAAAIPNAELVVLDDVGHLSNIEVPEIFNATLRRFLQQHRARTG